MSPPLPVPARKLSEYTLLGRSGLRVSPLCLGTMTFGPDWGWGSDADTSRAIFLRFLEAGGNFIDTADGYTSGHSEELLGQFMKEAGNRDQLVVATKFTFNARPGDPNAGGNGRKNIHRALEGSLKRLRTDYVDLYWLHAWDSVTPVEEVMDTLTSLVREGKVRYIGLSNTPAWYLARAQTLAELRGLERLCALQLEYSLVERNIEREHVPAALELGLGVCPWSPLAGGLLTGKYTRGGAGGEGEGRLKKMQGHGGSARFNERNWKVVDALLAVAKELGRPPAQVALQWLMQRPGVSSTIVGATQLSQLEDNLRALELDLPMELTQQIEEVSRPELVHPYIFSGPDLLGMINGGTKVRRESRGFRPQ